MTATANFYRDFHNMHEPIADIAALLEAVLPPSGDATADFRPAALSADYSWETLSVCYALRGSRHPWRPWHVTRMKDSDSEIRYEGAEVIWPNGSVTHCPEGMRGQDESFRWDGQRAAGIRLLLLVDDEPVEVYTDLLCVAGKHPGSARVYATLSCNLDANALGELAVKAFYDEDDEGSRNHAACRAEYAALCSVYTDGFETAMERLLTAMLDYRRTRGLPVPVPYGEAAPVSVTGDDGLTLSWSPVPAR